jgi:hypothetical protein
MIWRSPFVLAPPKVALVCTLLSISSCPSLSLWQPLGHSEDHFQGQRQQQQQLISYELIAGYQPVSLVTDQVSRNHIMTSVALNFLRLMMLSVGPLVRLCVAHSPFRLVQRNPFYYGPVDKISVTLILNLSPHCLFLTVVERLG